MTTSIPILLAHGICPFHRLLPFPSCRDNARDDRFHYFRKIRSTLVSRGFHVFHTRVGWASPLEKRSLELRNEILRITGSFTKWPGVHIIAHSMGGLDARFMIYRYRMERRVLSLTTIGTPHHGTSYADWGIRKFSGLMDFACQLGLNLNGFHDLSRDECMRRNLLLADFEKENGVLYQTVAGAQAPSRIFRHFRFSHGIILQEEGENDGLVSVSSAKWKEEYFLGLIDADHLNQIGWWEANEGKTGIPREEYEKSIREFYVRIASGLKDPTPT
jgi:triacylglycerol lipase